MKKIKILILLLGVFIFLTGCGADVKYYETINENKLISIVKEKVYQEYGDEVKIEIISKEDLDVCTASFDGCISSEKIKGSYSYELKVTNIAIPEIFGLITYHDTYIKDGVKIIDKIYLGDYGESKTSYNNKIVISDVLSDYDYIQYKLQNEDNRQFVYIYAPDKEKISDLLVKLEDTINNYWLMIYLIDDFNYYNTLNNDIKYISGKTINSSCGINFDIERNNDDEKYSQYLLEITNNGCVCNNSVLCTRLIGLTY